MGRKPTLDELADRELAPPRHLRPVPLDDLEHATIAAPEYAIEPLLPYTVVTLLGAHGGAGKSMLALCLAAHYAAGKNWAGLHIGGGPAVFVSLEDGGDLLRWRLAKICRAYGLKMAEVSKRLTIVDGSEGDCALVGEINVDGVRRIASTATMEELIEVCTDTNAGLVVIDNASDAYDADENARRQVRGFIRRLGAIAKQNNAAVLLLAHIDKMAARHGAQGNSYSGSTAWHNSVRSRLSLVHVDGGGIELRQEKLNLGKPSLPLALVWSDHGVLMHDPSVRADSAEPSAATDDEDDHAIVSVLAAAAAAGSNVAAARTGPANTLTTLRTFDLPRWVRGKGGTERFWASINRLQKSGRVEVESYRNDDHKQRQRIVVRQIGPPLISPHPYADGTGGTGGRLSANSSSANYPATGGTGGTGGSELDHAA